MRGKSQPTGALSLPGSEVAGLLAHLEVGAQADLRASVPPQLKRHRLTAPCHPILSHLRHVQTRVSATDVSAAPPATAARVPAVGASIGQACLWHLQRELPQGQAPSLCPRSCRLCCLSPRVCAAFSWGVLGCCQGSPLLLWTLWELPVSPAWQQLPEYSPTHCPPPGL